MKAAKQITEEQLVNLIEKRDKKVISILYENYSAALYGVIIRVVRSEELAEDVLQETFVKIWENSSSYNSTKGRLYTWMLNIARNSAIDATRASSYKAASKIQDITDFVNDANLKQTTINTDAIGLKSTIDKLKPEYKEVIDCVYFGGNTHTEAAEELQLPLGTVKTRVRNALKELRAIFK